MNKLNLICRTALPLLLSMPCAAWAKEARRIAVRAQLLAGERPTDLVAISVETYTARRAYEIASEYRYRDSVPSPRTLVVTISQSGETIDVLDAIRAAHRRMAATLSGPATVAAGATIDPQPRRI